MADNMEIANRSNKKIVNNDNAFNMKTYPTDLSE